MVFVNVRPYKKRGVLFPNTWECDITVHHPDGLPPERKKVKSPEDSYKKSKAWGVRRGMAMAARGRALKEKTPTPKAVPIITFSKLVDIYLDRWVEERELAKSTLRLRTRQINRYFVPLLGELSLDAINEEMVSKVRASLRLKRDGTKRSNAHRNSLLFLLGHMLDRAHAWKLMPNPPPPFPEALKEIEPEIEIYTLDELARLVVAAKEYSVNAFLIVMLGSEAGLRVAEMLGLRWSDIDLKARRLVVRQQEIIAGELTDPKWGKKRPIPLSDALHEALTNAQHLGERVLWHRGHEVTRSQLEMWLRTSERLAKLIGSKSPHKLRHSFATTLLEQGANPKAVQALLGHESLETTMRYLHLRDGQLEAAIKRLSGAQTEPKEEKVER